MKDVRGHTEGLERKEKEPDEEGKAREAVVLNCIKWSVGKKIITALRVAKEVFNVDVVCSFNRCFAQI